MDSVKLMLIGLGLAVATGFGCVVEAYTLSTTYTEKTYDQAVSAYNGATNTASKLHALSVIKKADVKMNRTNDLTGLNSFHSCMYRVTLKNHVSVTYNENFSECI